MYTRNMVRHAAAWRFLNSIFSLFSLQGIAEEITRIPEYDDRFLERRNAQGRPSI